MWYVDLVQRAVSDTLTLTMSKKQNRRAPIRVTVDLDAKDYASLVQVERTMRAMSKAETIRRLVRFAVMNPHTVAEPV